MRLLLVEDDNLLLPTLQKELAEVYAVDTAGTARDTLNKVAINTYDILIVDLRLPDGNGIDITDRLRSEGQKMPILILTADDTLETKVNALDAGADDYLTKPFQIEELKARLRALLRRPNQCIHKVLQVGDLELIYATRSATRAGKSIPLRRKEFDILELLMMEAGNVVSRISIMEHVWDESSATLSNVVDVHIKHLRDKIDRPFPTSTIKTVSGIGYRLDPTPR